jgi:beta-galactosidase GanA
MRRALSPGAFAEIAGVRSDAMLDLFEYNSENGLLEAKLQDQLGIRFTGSDAVYHPATIVESLHLEGAETLATVVGGRMEGKPAVTRHRSSQGWVFYVGVDSSDSEFYEGVARTIAGTIDLKPIVDAPKGVEVTSRFDGEKNFVFLLNLTEDNHPEIALPRAMDDVIGGRRGVENISLGPLGVAVLAYSA